MTELLTRPSARAYDEPSPSVWWRGCLAALWAVALGVATLVIVVLIAWATDSRTGASAGAAIRAALQVWLAAHRVPLSVDGGTIAVAPLFLTLAFAFLVARAGAVLARGQHVVDGPGVLSVAFAVAMPYAGLATFVAAGARTSAVRPAPVAALGCAFLLGVVAAGWGAARGAGLVGELWHSLPERSRLPLGAGGGAFAVLTIGASLLMLTGLVLHLGEASRMLDALGGGVVGAAAVVLLAIALLPNGAMCGVGYVAGPGFALGTGTSVTLTGAHTGPLPLFPLVAAVPRGPAPFPVELAVIAVLVGAGLVAAWLVARDDRPLVPSLIAAASAGAVTGLLVAIAAALAGGPAGPGRMAAFGVSPWQAGLAVAGEIAVVACGAVGALTWRRGR